MLIKMRKAQSTAEYAILFGLVIGGLVAMQTYLKRSMQGKLKDAGDVLTQTTGDINGVQLGTTSQYEPYYLSQKTSDTSRTQSSSKTETVSADEARATSETANVSVDITETEQSFTGF